MLQEEKVRKAAGQRGKTAEKKVKEFLTALGNQYAEFDWERKYDARSAGGRFPSQAGDFGFSRRLPGETVHGLIEVKEVDHPYRLPAKNFGKEQIAKLRKRQISGGLIVVLILHTSTGLWRSVPLSAFLESLSAPSWDLGYFPTAATCGELLRRDVTFL